MEIVGAAEIADGGFAGESSTKIGVQAEDLVDIECVGGDDQLFMGIAAAGLEPVDIFVSGYIGILAVDALAGPVGGPVGSVLEKLCGSERVRQHDAERAVVSLLPDLENSILGSFQGFIVIRRHQRSEDHGDLMRVGSDGLKIVLVGEEGVGGSGESAAQIRRHSFDYIFLPKKTVAAAGTEICDAEMGNSAQALDLVPQLGLGLGVQDV